MKRKNEWVKGRQQISLFSPLSSFTYASNFD